MNTHALLASAAILGATLSAASASSQIEWYPSECISMDYCGPVELVAWRSPAEGNPPQLTFSIGQRQAVVQRSFPVSASGDGRLHVCMRYDPFGTLEVTCLLVPPVAW